MSEFIKLFETESEHSELSSKLSKEMAFLLCFLWKVECLLLWPDYLLIGGDTP